jgi:hypothetical protein
MKLFVVSLEEKVTKFSDIRLGYFGGIPKRNETLQVPIMSTGTAQEFK